MTRRRTGGAAPPEDDVDLNAASRLILAVPLSGAVHVGFIDAAANCTTYPQAHCCPDPVLFAATSENSESTDTGALAPVPPPDALTSNSFDSDGITAPGLTVDPVV